MLTVGTLMVNMKFWWQIAFHLKCLPIFKGTMFQNASTESSLLAGMYADILEALASKFHVLQATFEGMGGVI